MPRRLSLRNAAQFGSLAALAAVFAHGPARSEDVPPPPVPDPIIITITASSAAFATGVFNSSIRDNVVVDIDNTSATQLKDSVTANLGIVQINQDAGVGSNQANMVLIAIAAGANPVTGASFFGEAKFLDNTIYVSGATRTNTIQNILAGSAGIVQINQNAGNLNVNLNFLGLALGLGTGNHAVHLSDSHLSHVASNNQITLNGPITQTNVIEGLSNFSGILQISQVNGDANVAANTMSINFTVINLP